MKSCSGIYAHFKGGLSWVIFKIPVGTTGDSYDNALAETVNGLYKTEVIEYLKADWQGLADVQLATLNWVDWFNKERVHSALGYVVNGILKLTPFTLQMAK